MKTLEELHGACRIEPADTGSDHLIWAGGMSKKFPRVWAPDYTKTKKLAAAETVMASQPGRRAAWHLTTGRALPNGWRVFATCDEELCVAHFGAGPTEKVGKEISTRGKLKHSIRRKLANRAIGRARSKLDQDAIEEIRQSSETGLALSSRLGVAPSVISKIRVHGFPSYEAIGGFASGLGARK